MSMITDIEDEIERMDRVILASEDWAKAYKKNRTAFKQLIKHESKLERILRGYFRTLVDERLNGYINWNKYETDRVKAYRLDVTVDIEEIDDYEGGELLTAIHDQLLDGIALGATTAEAQYNIELGLNKYSDVVLKATDKYVGDLVTQINNVTRDRIKQSIATSLKLGEDQQTASARLNKIMGDPKRSEMIARTEAVRSYNKGITTFGRASGYTRKFWEISSAPCEICAQNEGAEVGIDEDFPSGDSEAPAHPNCRCGNSLGADNLSDDDAL